MNCVEVHCHFELGSIWIDPQAMERLTEFASF